jgi:hypothetical protein
MPTSNTDLRLKAVVDILTEAAIEGTPMNAGQVLAEALIRIPPTEREAELLSGGVPRGHKALTTATSKLVKAGWLVKGRSGWKVTEDGMRSTIAFPTAPEFAAALASGLPVPEGTPLPEAAPAVVPVPEPQAKRGARKPADSAVAGLKESATRAVKKTGAKAVSAAAALIASGQTTDGAENGTRSAGPQDAESQNGDIGSRETEPQSIVPAAGQPAAVALPGDFNTLLGAREDWNPGLDEAQMAFDPADGLWKLAAELPAGQYTYKVAIERSWTENYGAYGVRDGANHELVHAGGPVVFVYDHAKRDVSVN